MNYRQRIYRNKLIAKIHCHKKYKEIYDTKCWEDWLYIRYGVESSKDLSIKELNEVLHIFDGLITDRDYCMQDRMGRTMILDLDRINKGDGITKNQALSIQELLDILRYDNEKSLHFFKHQTQRDVRSIKELSKEEATKVILGLNEVIDWDKQRLKYANNMSFNGV